MANLNKMYQKIKNFLRSIFCKEYPLWAYGIECGICKMTFISPEAHFEYAKKNGTIKKHIGKIPILKK